jgi:diacylglycerol kinase family enzyme
VITVLLNPAAGTALDAGPTRLAALFEAAGAAVRFITLGAGVDTAAEVRAAIAGGAEAIVAGGGDGTVSSVASMLVGSTTPFGVLPLGTLNHFAKDLGIPLDPALAVGTIVAAHTSRVDVGEVNARVFINNSSIGIYPDIVVERERLRALGRRKWIAAAIATARVLRHSRGLVVQLTSGHATVPERTPFVFVGNNEYETEGLHLGARRRLDCGKLFAYRAPRLRPRDLPKMLALALVGRVRRTHTLDAVPTRELDIHTPGRRRVRVALDGEVHVMATPLHFRIRPLALTVIVPAA